jgi:2-iminobutanoate/2-iminopropanoate deaminase
VNSAPRPFERRFVTGEREEQRRYSRAVVVAGGRTVYLAGVVDVDADGAFVAGDVEASSRAVLDRLRDAVEAVGGMMGDIVAMTVYLTDARWGDTFVDVRAEYFEAGAFPAATMISGVALAHPQLRIELQATAVLPS